MSQAAEQTKRYHVTKAFRSLNTKANRTAIDDNEFYWLENAQPIGAGNIRIIAAQKQQTNVAGGNITFNANVTGMYSAEVGSNNYIVTFQSDGGSQAYDVDFKMLVTVGNAATFSTANMRMTQWKNERIVIADPNKGIFTWDGNSTTSIGSVGVIGLSNIGKSYTTVPSVTISAPDQPGGVQAVATATIANGTISSITLTEPGTGYTSSPTVTISGGGGTDAQAVASIVTFKTGTVYTSIESGGTGYTNSANIVVGFSGGGGSNAAATAITSNGVITQVIMTNAGNGYTSAPTVTITGGNGSNAVVKAFVQSNVVTDVASFSGRIWVSQGRTVTYTGAGSYNDFVGVSAGNVFLADSTLHGNILSLLAANNFLYLFGDDSINVFSDVRVTTNGSTLFTNTNLSASVGTKRSNAIFPYFRYVMLLNDYGVYGLIGSTTAKLSDALDGIFPLIDFSYPVTGGQVLLNNILCAAWNFKANLPNGARVIQAVFFDKKWFITSQGALTYSASAPVGGFIQLYGTTGTDLYQLYGDANASVSSIVQTALWSLSDPIRDKQALKFGVEAILSKGGTITLTVDNESNSSPPYTLTNTIPGGVWINNLGNSVFWTNQFGNTIMWISGSNGYYLYKSDAQQWGKYLGYTLTSNSPGMTYSTFELEHELRARF